MPKVARAVYLHYRQPCLRRWRIYQVMTIKDKKMLLNDTAMAAEWGFESLYIEVRCREQRIYTNGQLLQLPDIEPGHVHYAEWNIRKRSVRRLLAYLSKKQKPLNILEIGCGNGWLAAKLAGMTNADVTGLDINNIEINQAKAVFKRENLRFINNSFNPGDFKHTKFDVVIFAASIQYFANLQSIIWEVQSCLAGDGEIHILDTNFYSAEGAGMAAKRTLTYYANMGYPKMADYYFHHQLADLEGFNYRVLANPNSIFNRLIKSNPFYWLCIKKS